MREWRLWIEWQLLKVKFAYWDLKRPVTEIIDTFHWNIMKRFLVRDCHYVMYQGSKDLVKRIYYKDGRVKEIVVK